MAKHIFFFLFLLSFYSFSQCIRSSGYEDLPIETIGLIPGWNSPTDIQSAYSSKANVVTESLLNRINPNYVLLSHQWSGDMAGDGSTVNVAYEWLDVGYSIDSLQCECLTSYLQNNSLTYQYNASDYYTPCSSSESAISIEAWFLCGIICSFLLCWGVFYK